MQQTLNLLTLFHCQRNGDAHSGSNGDQEQPGETGCVTGIGCLAHFITALVADAVAVCVSMGFLAEYFLTIHTGFPVTGIIALPEGVEMCMPGDNVEMDVELITPIAIEEGLRFAIREGGRTVGSGVVSAING